MKSIQIYRDAFIEAFTIEESQLDNLKYQDIEEWDSVGHMRLMAILEGAFDIMIDVDDMIDFSSYEKGIEILAKYDVVIE